MKQFVMICINQESQICYHLMNLKQKTEHQIMKTITSKLADIDEIPIGVYAHCICAVQTGIDYIMKHNYNVYCDIEAKKANE